MSRRCGLIFICFLTLIVAWGPAQPCQAVTPESPEVKAMVEKALGWLEKQNHEKLGGKCLIGLALYKANRPKSHPKIQEALAACKVAEYQTHSLVDNYSHGIAIMFMCEVDPIEYRQVIEKALAALLKRQQPGGGFSYENYQTGDTSQSQYAVLAMWMCETNGIKVPVNAMENVTNWFIRTQAPDGGWGYQAQDPQNYNRISQPDGNAALVAAGLGSSYIMADTLRLITPPEPQTTSALKEVKQKNAPRQGPLTNRVDIGMLRRCLSDGDRWYNEKFNQQVFGNTIWKHYCLYGIERYRSFRELSERKVEKEPKWYNDGYEYLRQTQDKGGFWHAHEDVVASTAFGVLFLLRSAKKAIAKIVGNLGDGVMLGGMGLPPNVADLREKNGKVVESKLTGSIDELIAMVSDDSNPELSRLAESSQAIELDKDVTKRAGQITKLRALVSAPAFESRIVAVRSLGKVRDFENVPILLYALSDPDVRVVREADKALRFISRKLEGFGPLDDLTKTQQTKLQSDWKKWFLSIRPDAELID